jgi:Isochorismatase family
MLLPSTSALVVLDAPVDPRDRTTALSAMAVVLEATRLIQAPILAARYPTPIGPGMLAPLAATLNPQTPLQFDPAAGPWPATAAARALAATGRNQLIVSGFWLEEAITLLALRSLSMGLDTYLAIDATAALDPTHAPMAHARLKQAGAVPTTSAQIVREWAALTSDVRVRADLLTLAASRQNNSP